MKLREMLELIDTDNCIEVRTDCGDFGIVGNANYDKKIEAWSDCEVVALWAKSEFSVSWVVVEVDAPTPKHKYNYSEAVLSDVLDYIRENYTTEEIVQKLEERDEWERELNDDLWTADSVTGNASGSYTFNTWRAEEYLAHNWGLLNEALLEFGCTDCNPIEKGAEWCDVTIRCYLLGQAIGEALDILEEEAENV